jgi:hypothetical protein
LGEVVTATAPANFRFTRSMLPAAPPAAPLPFFDLGFVFGTQIGAVQSISADSTQLTFVATPGISAPAVINGLRFTGAPQFRVTLPVTDTVVTPLLTPLPNADDVRTAPVIAFPAPGATVELFDAGPYNGPSVADFGEHSRLYRIDVTATSTLTFTLDYYEGHDLGIYISTDGTFAGLVGFGDANGGVRQSNPYHPETVTIPNMAPGSYIIGIANFGTTAPFAGDPSLIKISVSRAP